MGIDEDGAPHPPTLPNGIIIKRLRGAERNPNYAVHLDEPVRYLNPRKGIPKHDWILTDLFVCARHAGHPLDLLRIEKSKNRGPHDEWVIVNIANLSNGEYFAIGGIRRAE